MKFWIVVLLACSATAARAEALHCTVDKESHAFASEIVIRAQDDLVSGSVKLTNGQAFQFSNEEGKPSALNVAFDRVEGKLVLLLDARSHSESYEWTLILKDNKGNLVERIWQEGLGEFEAYPTVSCTPLN